MQYTMTYHFIVLTSIMQPLLVIDPVRISNLYEQL